MTWTTLFEDQFDTETADVSLQDHLPSLLGDGWIDEIRPGSSVYVDWDAEWLASPWWSGAEAIYLLATAELPADDQAIESSYVTAPNAVLLRYSDTANGGSGYLANYSAGNNSYQILRLDQGNETVLASVGPQSNHDNSVVIRLEAVGDSLSLYADGELKAQAQDSTYGAGLAGIQVNKSSSGFNFVRFQHDAGAALELFSQTATLDVWSDNVGLTSLAILGTDGSSHGLTSGAALLTQWQEIFPNDSTHLLADPGIVLLSGVSLSPAAATLGHQAATPWLGQFQLLDAEAALQGLASSAVILLLAAAPALDRQVSPDGRRKTEIIAGSARRITPTSNRMMRL
ncbi:hypothetical protein [Emcibacter nanhaiensis]|uniref:Uncharacterized protein n=1 Tax=Emcibacter nanhaiensis TaxID=1505037 RepID=A0A501PCF5_9PROT|nr:hypothetical protein [Emcibacter nanhaiensis]TPD57751.1 hypothetical protein FIV46_16750 [Emcibacter nanhaiensis]